MIVKTSSERINKAVEIAISDIEGNIGKLKSGLLEKEEYVLMAGADYDRPWTRDAAINTYNFLALYNPEVAKNTLESVLTKDGADITIGGQYWDKVIWALGAKRYVDVTGDENFMGKAAMAIANSLKRLEKQEFSHDHGLFRGPAVYGDGVSAYPYEYGFAGSSGSILEWINANPEKKHPVGYGIPMHTLSTNCAYYNAYMTVYDFTGEKEYEEKGERLKNAILDNFHREGKLKYITGSLGDHYEQEGMGVALGLMFNILPEDVVDAVKSTDNGIACVYPPYERYLSGSDMGRHSGTIWSFINCFYAVEAAKRGRTDIFEREFGLLADKALRDGQFFEIYHPVTGMPYGGLQEGRGGEPYARLKSCEHQSWSATGFMNMLIEGVSGMRILPEGVGFYPCPGNLADFVEIKDMQIRGAHVNVAIKGGGNEVESVRINSREAEKAEYSLKKGGKAVFEIEMD